jgi:hypothetical protein
MSRTTVVNMSNIITHYSLVSISQLILSFLYAIFYRTQSRNREICLGKLKEILAEAEVEPKERNMRVGIGEQGKKIRRVIKEKRTEVKKGRGNNKKDDF